MLNQNFTALLSALLGGFLSIVGSILANFYIHNASNRREKQKEMKSVIQTIYKDTQKILDNCAQLDGYGWYGYDVKRAYEELGLNMDEIEMLVDLYLGSLRDDFYEYKKGIATGIQISIKIDKVSPEYNVEDTPDIEAQEKATDKFRSELRNILQKG